MTIFFSKVRHFNLLTLVLGLMTIGFNAYAEHNLLPNGGFELGGTTNWGAWGNSLEADPTIKRTGSYSGRIYDRVANWQTAVVNALPLVTPGKIYRFSAWVQLAPGSDSQIGLVMAVTEGSGRNFTTLQTAIGKAGGWTLLSGEFRWAPTAAATELSIYFTCADTTRVMYVDDAELSVSENLLTNGGFEQGSTAGWSPAGSTVIATNAEKHSGQYSGLVSGRSAEWHSAWRSDLQTVLASGKTYRVSVWIKPSAGSDLEVELTSKQTNGGTDVYGPVIQRKICAAGEWTELYGGFTFINPGNTTGLSFYVYCFDPTRNYYLDDAEVRLDEVNVDLGAFESVVTQKATGFLHGLSNTQPSAYQYELLKPRIQRFAAFVGNPNMVPTTPSGEGGQTGFSSFGYMSRLKSAGAKQQVIVSDEYMWNGLHLSWGWPGDAAHNGKTPYQLLDEKIDAMVNYSLANFPASSGWQIEWDLWNEPDSAVFWGRSQTQFFETWKHAYQRVRALDPNAKIVGPSIGYFVTQGANPTRAGWLKAFLIYARNNNVLPDIVSWHEMVNPKEIPEQVQMVRDFMAANGIPDRPIDVNEYQGPGADLMQSPGNTVRFLSNLEDASVRHAIRACWNEDAAQSDDSTNGLIAGRLDNILTTYPLQSRAVWHVYKSYAGMAGQMVGVSTGGFISGLASVDTSTGSARILLGNDGVSAFTTKLTVRNLSQIADFETTGNVRVKISGIPFSGLSALTDSTTISDTTLPVVNDALELPISVSGRGAYEITLEAEAVPANPPQILSAVSRKQHGGAGSFDIPISVSASSSAGVESRTGSALNLIVTFDKEVASGSASLGAGVATVGVPTFSGSTMIIPVSSVTNGQYLQVNLGNVVSADGGILGNAVISLRVLTGDVNGSGSISGSDVSIVKAAVGSPLTSLNFRTDVNASGDVSGSDVAITKATVGALVP